MDLDLARHKEFRFSRDGAYVAVGIWQSNTKPEVCVIRVADGKRLTLAGVSYDFWGWRLDLDPESRTLFSGAYHTTGIAAYHLETGATIWERRDLKKLGVLRYDAFDDTVYCFCERRTVLLTASGGKERGHYRALNDVFFGRDPSVAIFDAREVKLQNRNTKTERVLARATENILTVAFTSAAAVLSWVGGPVVAYDLASGQLLWTYQPEGPHAYSIAPASDNTSIWVAEQPGYKEPPWQRVRLLSPTGKIEQEVRCALGHSFALAPYSDSVIRGNLALTPIAALGSDE